MRPTATRDSWRSVDTGGPFAEIPWQARFSSEEFARICQGAIPEEMEDRWFAFVEHRHLYLVRSWTGLCIYRVDFAADHDAFVVEQAWVSANAELYTRGPDDYESAFLEFLVRRLLLGETPPMPERQTPRAARRTDAKGVSD
jgi:hypothetical protein